MGHALPFKTCNSVASNWRGQNGSVACLHLPRKLVARVVLRVQSSLHLSQGIQRPKPRTVRPCKVRTCCMPWLVMLLQTTVAYQSDTRGDLATCQRVKNTLQAHQVHVVDAFKSLYSSICRHSKQTQGGTCEARRGTCSSSRAAQTVQRPLDKRELQSMNSAGDIGVAGRMCLPIGVRAYGKHMELLRLTTQRAVCSQPSTNLRYTTYLRCPQSQDGVCGALSANEDFAIGCIAKTLSCDRAARQRQMFALARVWYQIFIMI
jgi:hypothetical protein